MNQTELQTVKERTGGQDEIKQGACCNITGSMCLLSLTTHPCPLITSEPAALQATQLRERREAF